MRRAGQWVVMFLTGWVVWASLGHAGEPAYTRTKDVIYGRKYGLALTMDVFRPKQDANGAAIIWVVSGGWFSSPEAINPIFCNEYLSRGYTVFAVVHGSQPKFTIPEAIDDLHRAVRFIRHEATRFGIDGERIGITGGSAGGHLSLMIGTAGDGGKRDARDPVDRCSSRVQAVACFFPPTDFLNYGKKGNEVIGSSLLAPFRAPFDFRELDRDKRVFERVTDRDKVRSIARDISPIYHVSQDDPPTLIIHGDADRLVPLQQSEIMIEKLKQAGVPAKLVVKKGGGHGWRNMIQDIATLANWFDQYLLSKK